MPGGFVLETYGMCFLAYSSLFIPCWVYFYIFQCPTREGSWKFPAYEKRNSTKHFAKNHKSQGTSHAKMEGLALIRNYLT